LERMMRHRWHMAAGRLSRRLRNLWFDLRFGGPRGGSVRNTIPGAMDVVNTDYRLMPQLFDGRIDPSDVLVDIGSGKGRVLNYWLSLGLGNRIIGIELNEAVAAKTSQRLRRCRNATILAGDAIDLLPEDGSLFFLYNPVGPGRDHPPAPGPVGRAV
jgi:hypothetical protein